MSDPVAEAAAALSAASSSTEPGLLEQAMDTIHSLEAKVEHLIHPDAEAGAATSGEQSSSLSSGDSGSGEAGNVDAPTLPAGAATAAATGNVLLNGAPVVDAPVGMTDAPAVVEAAEPLPRESHLLLLEAKVKAFRAKLANAERVTLDEFEAIVEHVKAVL